MHAEEHHGAAEQAVMPGRHAVRIGCASALTMVSTTIGIMMLHDDIGAG